MARARSGGGTTGWVVATVLMTFGFVISLVLAIIFATQLGGARQQRDEATRSLDGHVRRAERSGEAYKTLEARAKEDNKTVYAMLDAENRGLKALISSSDAGLEQINAEVKRRELPEGSTLLGELDGLKQNLDDERTRHQQATAAREIAEKGLGDAETERTEALKNYEKSVANVRSGLDDLSKDLANYKRNKDTLVSQLAQHLQQERGESADKISRLQDVRDEMAVRISELELRIEERQRFRQDGGIPNAIQAVGQLVTIDREESIVHINLTRNDRVQLGMTFEVFDRNVLVTHDQADMQGKATIEVIRITDTSSAARVVQRDPRATLAAGDQIINVAFDPTAVYRFYVHGVFDVDNIGSASVQDNRRVRAMIERWGGKVVDELNYQTDYLVMGMQPILARQPDADAGFEEIQIYERLRAIYQAYRHLEEEAKKLKIPILNQNRFLRLVGHYNR